MKPNRLEAFFSHPPYVSDLRLQISVSRTVIEFVNKSQFGPPPLRLTFRLDPAQTKVRLVKFSSQRGASCTQRRWRTPKKVRIIRQMSSARICANADHNGRTKFDLCHALSSDSHVCNSHHQCSDLASTSVLPEEERRPDRVTFLCVRPSKKHTAFGMPVSLSTSERKTTDQI